MLQALEQAELITIQSANGRPYAIRPGKPVYLAAFQMLTEDSVLKSRLDLATFSSLSKLETQGVEKFEAELGLLGSLPGSGKGVEARVRWLMGKLREAQEKVERYERESAVLKKIIKLEY